MKNSENLGYFHCGKCGSFYSGPLASDRDQTCSVCSKDPCLGLYHIDETSPAPPKVHEGQKHSSSEFVIDENGRRAVRKKRKVNTTLNIIIIWTFVMLLAVWVRSHYSKIAAKKDQTELLASRMIKGTLADESVAFVNAALPDCHRALGGFLTSGSPEARNQFVVNPIETAGKMAIFYAQNPIPMVDVAKLTRTSQELVKIGEVSMILTHWKEAGGVEFDAIFRRDAGQWRLDWNHFSQYSSFPWALFLAGQGPSEGEFRLLARRRLVESDSERVGSRLIFALTTPVFGKPGETGMESPDFVIDSQSDEGLILRAAFSALEEGKKSLGQTTALSKESGLIPVRVRVKRSELGGNRTLSLEKVSACHWVDSEELGFDLTVLKDDLFGN